jgi:hypothetical protein
MTTTGYNLLAALSIIAAATIALAGSSEADDLLAAALVGLAGTIAGRGKS